MAATSPHEQHEVVFRWPHTEPSSVILTGSFDDWSKSINLPKTDKGFETRIRLPYGQKTPYKFIVDGTWLVDSSNPTEYDNIGNLNNVYDPPPQPPVTKVTPPGTPVVIGDFQTSKETTSPAKVPKAANGVNGSYFPKLNGDDDKSTKRSSSRLSLSDLASTLVARDGVTSAYEYVKSGLGAVIGGVVGVDPINAGQIAIPTPNTAAANTTFNSEVPTEPTPPVTSAGETQLAPNVPIAIVPVNSAENNTIVNSPAGENGNAKENEHTHSPVISPVKGASKGPLIPIDNIPVLDKDAQDKADPVLPEEEKKEEAPTSAKEEEETPAPEADKKEDTPAPAAEAPVPTAAPVSEEVLDKAVPTPLGPVVPPEATKEEEKETAPAPEPTPAVVEAPPAEEKAAPAPAPEAPKEEEKKVEAERPATPPPATTVTAPSAPSSPSKPAPAESAPTTPLNVKKGGSFKRGSLSSAFGSIKGRKEARRSVSASAASNGKDSSSSSSSSSDGGKEGGKKKKRESIFKKIKRVLTPHHHHHNHEHEHGHGEGEIKEKA